MRVLSRRSVRQCVFYVIGREVPEFVVQIVDRHSPILGRHIAETLVWKFVPVAGGRSQLSADAAFRRVASTSPVAKLRVASLEAAIKAVE